MTELSFLIDLLLNHKLPVATRKAVAERIKVVEQLANTTQVVVPRVVPQAMPVNLPPEIAKQAPSTQALMLKHMIPNAEPVAVPAPAPSVEPAPVAVVAQNAITASAMASRQQAIADSIAGKINKEQGRPRKF